MIAPMNAAAPAFAPLPPIAALRAALTTPGAHRALIEQVLERAAAPAAAHVFIGPVAVERARAVADAADALLAAGRQPSSLAPLAGLPVTVKDLYDIEGEVTLAGSVVRRDAAPATTDAPAVARLRAAGAAIVGRTNMTEFAFSGLGLNPHHGTPRNPCDATVARIAGGSSSGAAVSVALGLAVAGLGSDTGGSIRIPAALQGLVGYKSTQRLTPLDGTIPLSTSLDTACAITLSVRDAVLLHEVLAGRRVALQARPTARWRFAVPTTLMLDGLDPAVARGFEAALAALRAAGATVDEIALPELAELAAINAQGGLPAAESWAWHRARLERDGERYDPRVALRIRRGAAMSAADYIGLMQARRDWIGRVEAAVQGVDALLAPTVPMLAPPIAPLQDDDEAFFATNALMLRNPSVVNFLDGCAISLPCHAPGDWPVGLMLFAPALQDDRLLSAALAVERVLAER
jgi:Asp-tRNA(Asn)/Glu-tRNA(Gln) amidotransferase A subunit family amidase